jgi:hypothetical protein
VADSHREESDDGREGILDVLGKGSPFLFVRLEFLHYMINDQPLKKLHRSTATISVIYKAPPAALFNGGNASAAAHVSLSSAKMAAPLSSAT